MFGLIRMLDDLFFFMILGAIIMAFVTAWIASGKGKNYFLWLIYGFFLFPWAFLHALLSKDEQEITPIKAYEKGLIQCPSCLEWVKLGAKVCRYCHSPIPENTETPEDRLRANGYGGIVVPKEPTKKPQDNQQ
ncbi:hypothetical protein [Veillonella magna]|uniref:hypothetical protein n=1 Tax=Veillonella magna TaxID=464322 RepID=UPI0026DC169B|nr:hypothetical protein [Veillonella magna]